jgi:hypothetical protein
MIMKKKNELPALTFDRKTLLLLANEFDQRACDLENEATTWRDAAEAVERILDEQDNQGPLPKTYLQDSPKKSKKTKVK